MTNEERRYSVSQISCYLACPLKYRFQYVEERPKAFRPSGLAFGATVHAAIEWLGKVRMQGEEPSLEDVFQVFAADWFAQNLDPLEFPAGESKESLERKARAMLETYLVATRGRGPAAVEEHFALEIADPETGECLGIPFRGIVDLIEDDGTLVDLKTAARAMPQADVDRHLQLSTYALAVFLRKGAIPKLRLDVLLKGAKPRLQQIETSRSVEDLAWTARLIQRTTWAIEESHFFPNPSWRCAECEYREPCQGWRGA